MAIDYKNSFIKKVSAHKVGNKANQEELSLSSKPNDILDVKLHDLLKKYFLSSLKVEEFYTFTSSNGDVTLNPVFSFCSKIFDDENCFHEQSQNIAQHLYHSSDHPNIKPGDFYVSFFKDILYEDDLVEAVGFFKAEKKHSFIQLIDDEGGYKLKWDDGVSIEKLDKGCLVLNVEKDSGYKVLIVDKVSKKDEAHYWKDIFLKLKPCADSYHHTQSYLNLTKDFIDSLKEDIEVGKTDQIDLENKSIDYFKTNNSFDQKEFDREILGDPKLVDSFKDFSHEYETVDQIPLSHNFEIAPQAVKKQAKFFKSVLKLDKNFHVYIHGNKNLIERGIDNDGRKFYKLFYQEET
ncbi:MAG: nucleoid-associated protein [Nitrospinae bacterium]|nr:nucleoid-associated protein [Nitrospinota bacterium]